MSRREPRESGRKRNEAMPLGHREGGDTDEKVKATGRREQRSAGPDGPSAKAIGDTFKRPRA